MQQAQIAYLEGWWAARRGDYTAAQTQADRISRLLEPDANPRKLEPMHQLKGFIALYQGKYQEAAGHLRQGNPFDPYVKYQLAVATGNDRPYAGRSTRHLERSARHVDHALVHVQDRVGRRHPEDAIPCPAPQWDAGIAA